MDTLIHEGDGLIGEIRDAAARLEGHAVRTPLLHSEALSKRVGGRVLVKAEPLQKTGSFKYRGAFNFIAQMTAEEKRRGVVAFSSGNHAQGVALAATEAGCPAVVVMPADAPSLKIARTRAFGAEVVLYDRWREDREAIARTIADGRGAVLVPPFDHRRIIAGQGTVGLEAAEQAKALGHAVDSFVVCCGGGGLTAGAATAVAEAFPQAQLVAAEPEAFDDTARSLAAGERLDVVPGGTSFCDALLGRLGEITFAVNRRLLSGVALVSDAQVAEAMRAAFLELKVVVEPGGAVALAAILSGKVDCRGRTVLVVLSGGNVDPAQFAGVLAG
jgi:threonine dehydratase